MSKTYILLKDLPDCKAGTEFTLDQDIIKEGLASYVGGPSRYYIPSDVENNPEWFKEKEDTGGAKARTLELLLKAIPYPDHITRLDITTHKDAIQFTWRNDNTFRLYTNLEVEEVEDGFLTINNISILLRNMIKRANKDLIINP